jgi:electron transfer flavoprotein beta subunit
MNILVCLSQVPDTTTRILFTADGKSLDKNGVQFIINPYDELALTKALELNESMGGGRVTVVHVGRADSESNLRKAMAIGADQAIRVDSDATDAIQVARELAAIASKDRYDLILCGRESIDYNGGMVGGMLAELLGLPLVNIMTSISSNGTEAEVSFDVDGGRAYAQVAHPFVATCQKELTEPRIPNMRGIMQARTKPLEVVAASVNAEQTQVSHYEPPVAKSGCRFVDAGDMDQLVSLLHEQSKVI